LKHQKTAHNASDELAESYAAAVRAIRAALFDDMNTSLALAEVARLASESEALGVHPEKIQPMLNIVDQLFGLQLSERPTINDTQKTMITERQAARESKDWVLSDQLRDQLKEQGITVRDTANGPIWQRI